MRARTVGIFSAGFAAGALVITLLMWHSGALHESRAAAQAERRMETELARPAPSSPAPNPNPSAPAEQPPAEVPRDLIIPVKGATAKDILDTFDVERPGGGRHEAVDILAPRGTPVLAAAEGNVVKLFTSKQGGLTVYQFDNSQTWCYYYAHLDRYAPGLKEGTLLRQGDVLGYAGASGNADPGAPHLHFAIFKTGPEKHWWQGTPINPYPLLAGPRR